MLSAAAGDDQHGVNREATGKDRLDASRIEPAHCAAAGLPDSALEASRPPRWFVRLPRFVPLLDGGTGLPPDETIACRASEQLQDIHARAIAVDDVDQAAIVDVDVVGHVVAVRRVGVGFRNVEGNLRRVDTARGYPRRAGRR